MPALQKDFTFEGKAMTSEPHRYKFDCNCPRCVKITEFFHLKSKDEARKLGYDLS